MKNFKWVARIGASLLLLAVVLLSYRFVFAPVRAYTSDVLSFIATHADVNHKESWLAQKLSFSEKLALPGEVQLVELAPVFAGMPAVQGIVHVTTNDVNIRTAPNPLDNTNISHTTQSGELYTYYNVADYEGTPWYEIITTYNYSERRYISSTVVETVATRGHALAEEEQQALLQFMQDNIEGRQQMLEARSLATLEQYAEPGRNVANQLTTFIERMNTSAYQVALLEGGVVDGLKLQDGSYWLRVQEQYDVTYSDGSHDKPYMLFDYIVRPYGESYRLVYWFQVYQ